MELVKSYEFIAYAVGHLQCGGRRKDMEMKNKNYKLILLNLQLFAEGGDGGGSEGGDGGGSGAEGGSGSGAEGGNDPVSFDDFLKQGGNQAEFDRRIQKAINTAVGKAQEKWKALSDDKLSEAEKLAKMTNEEKEEYLRNKERREFEKEKADFEKEKLLVEVKKELQEQSLPTEFADSLVNIADAGKIKDAIEEIKKVWDAKITEAIKAKARQDPPQEGGQGASGSGKLSSIRQMARDNRIIK